MSMYNTKAVVCLCLTAVRPSVKLVDRIVRNRKKVLPRFFIPYERTFIIVFRHEEWLVGGGGRRCVAYLKFWAKLTPFEQKRRFSIDICSLSP